MAKNYCYLIVFTWFLLSCFTVNSQLLDADLLEINFLPDGNPEALTRSNNGFYFTSEDDQLWFSDATVEGTYLIRDFKSGYYNEIRGITPLNDKVFFSAMASTLDDYQLYISNGTEEGTIALTNRNVPNSQEDAINHIVAFNGLVFFSAYDENMGNELWVSDGTPEGTHVFIDIVDGASGSFPADFFVFDNKLFFDAYTEDYGQELWVSDGTPEGTILFKDINPGSGDAMLYSKDYIVHGNLFYFFADNGTQGMELWKSDGTSIGTVMVKDIESGIGSSALTLEGGILNGQLIFAANDGIHGKELWLSDGTENGTILVTDINSGLSHGLTYNSPLVVSNSAIFFVGYYGPASQVGVWASNGTPEGTVYLGAGSPNTFGITPLGESVLYYASGPNNSSALWRSDGTLTGTEVLSEGLHSGTNSLFEVSFLTINDLIFFPGKTEVNGTELWISDGTAQGTNLFKDLNKTSGIRAGRITEVGDKSFFSYNGSTLGVSDGTAPGTYQIPVIVEGRGTADRAKLVEFNDRLIFVGYDSDHGYELWTSDGTAAGTKMIKDIRPGAGGSLEGEFNKHSLTKIGDKVYFSANNNASTNAIWVTDGTEEGTIQLADINLSSGGPIPNGEWWDMPGFTVFNDIVYFLGNSSSGLGLYRTLGPQATTEFVYSLSRPRNIIALNNGLILVADANNTSYSPNDLYFSDGTAAGTSLIMTFIDGLGSGGAFMTILNEELYFIERNQENLIDSVYKTDGTTEGTVIIYDGGTHLPSNIDINDIFSCGEYVYFGVKLSLDYTAPNLEIWRTDGTNAGTLMLASSEFGYEALSDFTCLNDILYFIDNGNRHNLWATNGNPADLLKLSFNVTNGQQLTENGSIQEIGTGLNQIYLSATTEESGAELYITRPSSLQADSELIDSDSDGIIDFFDKCEDTPTGETVNELGCSESQLDDDEDSVPNSLDLCPDTETNEVVDENGCSDVQIADDDNDGVVNAYDVCPNTTVGALVNDVGCAESQLDEDGDGVMNDVDICPGTENNFQVDTSGCPVLFTLPGNNFMVKTIGETCIDKSNGQIIIEAEQPFNYIASVAGTDYPFTSSVTIENLTPGTYSLCIGVQENPEFNQCFNLTIDASEILTGKSTTIMEGTRAKESFEILSGTAPYRVQINGQEVLNTVDKSFTLEINDGDNVQITSQFPCEGLYEKIISTKGVALTYPNPTKGEVRVFVPGLTARKVQVEIYNSQLQLLDKAFYETNLGEMDVSLVKYPAGIYFLKIGQEQTIYFKLIRL